MSIVLALVRLARLSRCMVLALSFVVESGSDLWRDSLAPDKVHEREFARAVRCAREERAFRTTSARWAN
jgi:hypothetical protein